MNEKALHLLLAEDSDDDAFLVQDCLKRHGFKIECTRVMTAADFRDALATGKFEIILCDYSMPGFDAMEALSILHESGRDIPLIIVSGTIGETVAVEAMRNGAVDYLLKDNLIRLGVAVEREIREGETRRQKRLFDGFAQSQGAVLEMILNGVPLPRILDHITGVVESLCPDEVLSLIMLLTADGTQMVIGAGPGFDGELGLLPARVEITLDTGPCSSAAQGETVITPDIRMEPQWSGHHEVADRLGLRACWSVPVFSSERKVIGTIEVYHHEARGPKAEELHWVESASRLASLAIERSHAAEKLRASESLLRIASESARIGGWIVDYPESRITWSDQVCAIHEVPPGTSPALEHALGFFVPECRERISRVFGRCVSTGEAFDEELQIISASGRRVWVRSIGEAIRDDNSTIVRIQGAFQDITAKKLAEETRHADELRYLRQRNALISLTKDTPADGIEILKSFRRITETTARTLDVARMSIWKFVDGRKEIECLDLYELTSDSHAAGARLKAIDHPLYFQGLADLELITADDALKDPSTQEFSTSYLIPNGINAILDVPIHLGNRMDHLMCCEHVGQEHQWTADEKTFVVAVANLISLALESRERALAQNEVMRSHQLFQSVAAATNDTIWDWNLETDAFWWNDGFANLFGWAAPESGADIEVWIQQVHPEDRDRVVCGVKAAIENGDTHWSDEYRFISKDGSVAHVVDRGQVIRNSAGKGLRMVGGMIDLTASRVAELELARSHRALRMLSACNEMLVRASGEDELLAEACRIAVEVGGYRMAWVGYLENGDSRRILPVAHAGHENGYLLESAFSWDGDLPEGCGPVGQAVRSGEAAVFEDLLLNPEFSCWHVAAECRGYRHVVCLPLQDAGRVFGVLCFYGEQPHSAGEDELKVLRQMANDLSFGIQNLRERVARRRIEEVVIKVAQAVSQGAGSEFFDLLVRNMVEALGAQGGLVARLEPDAEMVDTISLYLAGMRMGPVAFKLAGTPCEEVAKGGLRVFEKGLKDLFPEYPLLEKHGIESFVGIPLNGPDGGVAGIMAVVFTSPLKEIELVSSTLSIFAERAASELARRQADARIREQASLLDKAQDAILVRDLDHTITYWNKGAERLYGWTADEAIGCSVVELLYREPAAFHKAHEHTLATGEWLGELNQIDKCDHDLTVEGRWTLMRDDEGNPKGVFVINTDISEYRKLEQQFLRAQRIESIGTLAGGIAHDLNNILAPILMAVELLRLKAADERTCELLEMIAISAKRGANMVGQVLSFAHGMEGCRVDVNPRQLIREIETILRDTFPRNIEMEFLADGALWTVHGDPTQLHQVLLNLCLNARDAITGAGRIRISAENQHVDAAFAATNLEAKEGPYVRIQVEDTGQGITPEIMERIFDPFFTTKAVGKGTGLGLSTSLAIVKSHGGFIRTSSKPGKGSVFRIYLPALIAAPEPAAFGNLADLPGGREQTVLVVDDEELIRNITGSALEAFGYRKILAANGEEAVVIHAARHSEIDVVVTDMMMPGMGGAATIRRMVEIDPAVRIIATSGISTDRASVLGLAPNVRDFLAKPYSAEDLLNSLSKALDGPEGLTERSPVSL